MVKSHVAAPAVYLKNFRIQKGLFKSNSDPLYVFDKLRNRKYFNKNTRGKWIEKMGFFSDDIETFNNQFETEYPNLYEEIVRSFKNNSEIPNSNRIKILYFIANMRSRHVSGASQEFNQNFNLRNKIIKPLTKVFLV